MALVIEAVRRHHYELLTDFFRNPCGHRLKIERMKRMGGEAAVWGTATAAAGAALIIAPILIAAPATLVLAAFWCRKIGHEEHAVQLLDSDSPAVNL